MVLHTNLSKTDINNLIYIYVVLCEYFKLQLNISANVGIRYIHIIVILKFCLLGK